MDCARLVTFNRLPDSGVVRLSTNPENTARCCADNAVLTTSSWLPPRKLGLRLGNFHLFFKSLSCRFGPNSFGGYVRMKITGKVIAFAGVLLLFLSEAALAHPFR